MVLNVIRLYVVIGGDGHQPRNRLHRIRGLIIFYFFGTLEEEEEEEVLFDAISWMGIHSLNCCEMVN